MATIDLNKFYVKPFSVVKNDFIRTIKNGYQQRGVTVNVAKNSDYDILGEAIANEIVAASNNTVIKADKQMPDTATGTDLDRIGNAFGVPRRPAGGSIGNAVALISASTFVPAGAQLVDATGLRYQVSTGGTLTLVGTPPGSVSIAINSLDTGAATNHAKGDTLTWVAPPPFCSPVASVDLGGLTNGTDVETDDQYRPRLLARLRNPPAGGNSSQIIAWAQAGNPAVQMAWVFPGLDGPATFSVAIAAAMAYNPTLSRVSRQIQSSTTQSVGAYVAGQIPEYANLKLLSVADSQFDVAIGLTLPSSITANPPGPGGGWIDASPWPALAGSATRVYVSSVTSPTTFVLTSDDAGNCPVPGTILDGVTKISWFDPVNLVMKTSTILSHSGSNGNVTVTIDPQNQFGGIAANHFIGPSAQNINTYCQALLKAFAQLGPGEATVDGTRLPRAARHPAPTQGWPASLTALQTKSIQDTGSEVLDVRYNYQSISTPTVPVDTNTAVNILTPRYIGFYKYN